MTTTPRSGHPRLPYALLATLALCAPLHAAGDAAKGKAKAAACAACHGPAGKAVLPNTPNLAGQVASYLEIALKAYRDGKRSDPMMSPMAKPLTDDDIANLAAHFSSL